MTTEILSFASGGGANVISQSAYAALATLRANGFSAGVAESEVLNKVWRQSSFVAAALATFVSDQGPDVPDDGDVQALADNIALAITSIVNSVAVGVKPGTIIDWSGPTAPAGYLACPQTLTNISRTTYAALFAEIGTQWGAGDGSTTFGLPFFPEDYAAVAANANVGTQTTGEVKAHTHSYTHSDLSISSGYESGNFRASVGATTGSTGGAANKAAGSRVLKCIKY